ncbi:hypothetical protein FACS1894202_14790 [Clostridia bacterium]|nr:hypothetical protein FACS1894202_14790 [Clostridia bacterium]
MAVATGNTKLFYRFKNVYNSQDVISCIFPLRQLTLLSILNNLPESVEQLYVFGSALTMDCRIDSDIDICVVGDIPSSDVRTIYGAVPRGEKMDLVIYGSLKELEEEAAEEYCTVARSILETGLLVFNRKDVC